MTTDPNPVSASAPPTGVPPDGKPPKVLFARLLVGFIVLICAEVFSGASLGIGLWGPWTLLCTFWLYFAHFFLFTTLAIRTGRTSLSSLYLWGVLFGLYESWITKVIWHGYGGDGKFAMGHIGPYGFSEISMVFAFHPVMSFLLPLAVACLLCPPLRRCFPDLAWFTAKTRRARFAQAYLVFCLAPVMAMNSGGPVNLAANLAFAIVVLAVLSRLARPALSSLDGRRIVAFGSWGFGGLCVYLAALYIGAYFAIRPEGLPSAKVQLFTFVFYGLAVGGLRLHRKRSPLPAGAVIIATRELLLVKVLFAVVLSLALALSTFRGTPVLLPIHAPNFILWTLAGFVLTGLSLARGIRESLAKPDAPRDPGEGDSLPQLPEPAPKAV